MSVNSIDKGRRGEYLVRDMLRLSTGLKFERVPVSGAVEYLKGDLYVPDVGEGPLKRNRFCIEVKNYADSPLNDKIFTQVKTNDLVRWWKKLLQQAAGGKQEPLLFFKYNRSPVFVVTAQQPKTTKYMYISWLDCYVALAEEWLTNEKVDFLSD